MDKQHLKWSTIVKTNAHYQCQICGSTEFLQAHDPTHRHIDTNDGQCLCAEHHSMQHPDIPHNLFFNKRLQPYWDNISASSLAKRVNVCSRTIIRNAKHLNIKSGTLSKKNAELLIKTCKHRDTLKTEITTIRIPAEILDRIKILAAKRNWSTSKWISVTLERVSKPRN